MDVLETIRLSGLIPVLKFNDAADAVPTCKAVSDGGLKVAEITFRTDAAEEAIRAVCRALPDMLVGAGTVTKTEQAERAVRAGARFIVAPGLNPAVVRWCVDNGVPVVPGINDPSGIEAAMELGLTCVKFFPAEASGGVKFLKAIHGPYPDMKFVPTGGVNEDNLADYLKTPGVVACGGSWMVPASAVENGDYGTIRALVRQAVNKMLNFRLAHVGVNTANEAEAGDAAARFERLFGFEEKAGAGSVMAGGFVELMKKPGPGERGHIGIRTDDIERAVFYIEQAGFAFDRDGAKRDDKGALRVIYLRDEIAGFAVHLVQG